MHIKVFLTIQLNKKGSYKGSGITTICRVQLFAIKCDKKQKQKKSVWEQKHFHNPFGEHCKHGMEKLHGMVGAMLKQTVVGFRSVEIHTKHTDWHAIARLTGKTDKT